jgi:Flp pilus assembly protein TadG
MTRHTERGASMVETGIALLLLLIVVFGIIDYGRAMYAYDAISNAARLGTRYAIVRGSQCQAAGCPATGDSIQTFVRAQAPLIDTNRMTVTTTWPNGNCKSPGCPVLVTVTYPFDFVSPVIPLAVLTMSSSSQMIISQ